MTNTQKLKEDFKCFFCHNLADRIMYYSKLYQHPGGTIENPFFVCGSCRKIAYDNLNQDRGGNEGIKTISFKDLSKYSAVQIGSLVSKKREINHLATVRWRSLLWRIHFLWGEPKAHHDVTECGAEIPGTGI